MAVAARRPDRAIRLVLGWVASLVTALWCIGPLPDAQAAPAQAAPAQAAPAQAGPDEQADMPGIALVSISGAVTAGQTQRVVVDVSGPGAGDGPWELAITIRAAASEARLREAFADRPRGSVIEVRRVPVAARVRQSIDLPIGRCDTCVPIERPGVYPVLIELRRPDGGTVADSLALAITIVDPASSDRPPPVRVAVVARLHQPPGVLPDGSDRPVDLRSFVETTEALARHPDVAMTVELTAETVESIQRQGGGGGVLDTLRGALRGRSVIAGPYVRWRDGVPEAAGLGVELRRQRERSAEVIGRLGVEPRTDLLISTSGALPSVAALDRVGAAQLIVGPEMVTAATGADIDPDRPIAVDVGAVDGVESPALGALITDARLTAALRPAGRENDAILGAVHVAALLAARAQRADGPRVAVIVLPDSFAPGLNTLLDLLGRHPAIRAVTVEEILDMSGSPQVVRPALNEPRIALPRVDDDETATLRRQIDGIAALRGDRVGTEGLDHRLAASLAADLADVQTGPRRAAEDVAASYRSALRDETTNGLFVVDLVPGGTYRLTARRGQVPITITSTADRPLTVRVQASSDRLQFPGFEVVPGVGAGIIAFRDVVLDQRSTTVLVPVSARTSGSFRFQVTVSTPSEEEVALSSTSYTVRSTAVSGVGVVLTLMSGLILAGWWLRHVVVDRRVRRRRAAADHPAGGPLRRRRR